MDPADATSIVSIAGAMLYTERSVDGMLCVVKELPHILINGDYVRTSRHRLRPHRRLVNAYMRGKGSRTPW